MGDIRFYIKRWDLSEDNGYQVYRGATKSFHYFLVIPPGRSGRQPFSLYQTKPKIFERVKQWFS
jgi:hypothetical protein